MQPGFFLRAICFCQRKTPGVGRRGTSSNRRRTDIAPFQRGRCFATQGQDASSPGRDAIIALRAGTLAPGSDEPQEDVARLLSIAAEYSFTTVPPEAE